MDGIEEVLVVLGNYDPDHACNNPQLGTCFPWKGIEGKNDGTKEQIEEIRWGRYYV